MENNREVIETTKKSWEKNSEQSKQCRTEKFIIRKCENGQWKIVPHGNPNIFSSEMNTEIQGDHKKCFKISSEEYIGFGNNHLPSKPVII